MSDPRLLLDNQLCFALHAVSRGVTQAYGPILEPLGVTYPQYLVLLVLWEGDGLTVGGIGDRLFLDSGTLTPLLKRLEGQGLVTRQRDPEDERAVRIALTDAGRKLKRRAGGVAESVACALGIDHDEIRALREPLRKILFHLHESDPESSPEPRALRTKTRK